MRCAVKQAVCAEAVADARDALGIGAGAKVLTESAKRRGGFHSRMVSQSALTVKPLLLNE